MQSNNPLPIPLHLPLSYQQQHQTYAAPLLVCLLLGFAVPFFGVVCFAPASPLIYRINSSTLRESCPVPPAAR